MVPFTGESSRRSTFVFDCKGLAMANMVRFFGEEYNFYVVGLFLSKVPCIYV